MRIGSLCVCVCVVVNLLLVFVDVCMNWKGRKSMTREKREWVGLFINTVGGDGYW